MGLLGLFTGLFSRGGLRGTVYTLFGALVLTTLWVTSLAVLTAQSSATALLTEAGTQVLNPFLVKQNILVQQGLAITPDVYAHLQKAGAKTSVPLFTVQVQGSDLSGKSYADGVRFIYGKVADTYYTGGPGATFAVPTQFSQINDLLHNFALFDPNNIPLLPNGPTPTQLPVFLQPLFTVVLLSPDTFTAAGHQNLLNLLPWFWLATVVLGALAFLLNRSEKKVTGLLQGVLHGSWPIVAILAALWVASITFWATALAPYTGILGIVNRAFLTVYGTALGLSVLGLLLMKVLPAIRGRQAPGGEQAQPAVVGARARGGSAASSETPMGGGSAPFGSGPERPAAMPAEPSEGQPMGQPGQMGGQPWTPPMGERPDGSVPDTSS